ncbi:MAG: phosphopentomutase [Clostridia bacterium]|nr:phosphopentomutase [Clostridia bacterium]
MKRVFLIVLDSVGIGEMPDAERYGDKGSNTMRVCSENDNFSVPNMRKMGLFNIDGMDYEQGESNPTASYARMEELSNGKDTIIGHWEIAGIQSKKPLPTYPNGFPKEIIEKFEKLTGRKTLCNKPYSGTEVIKDYGKESTQTGSLIVYTSADSVFQIAAHEEVVPVEDLYKYCQIARGMLCGEHAAGRVIARPFVGEYPNYRRTTNRHDFALAPPEKTMLDFIKESGKEVIAVGKISDIFAGRGVTEKILTKGNADGINKTLEIMDRDFEGLCFVNLVDFDMLYGHRNDVDGYAKALTYFDDKLGEICGKLRSEDILIITADHGCDPTTASTDHSREYTPMIIYGKGIKPGVNLGTRKGFSDTGATVLEYLGIEEKNKGKSFLKEVT